MGIDRLSNVPMFIDDTPEPGILKIRSRARRWCRRFGLRMIVVDYLQLLQGAGDSGRQINSRENEIAYISRSLKLLAKDLNIPIIAVSQLNRAVDSRTSKKPRLSDLRESGAIEQDADMVILISREDYYEGAEGPSVPADINLAKNRTGPTDEFQLIYTRNTFKFDNFSARNDDEMH
jgi:replicative DNA helicase